MSRRKAALLSVGGRWRAFPDVFLANGLFPRHKVAEFHVSIPRSEVGEESDGWSRDCTVKHVLIKTDACYAAQKQLQIKKYLRLCKGKREGMVFT